jgi:hypothetical protein
MSRIRPKYLDLDIADLSVAAEALFRQEPDEEEDEEEGEGNGKEGSNDDDDEDGGYFVSACPIYLRG